MLHEGQLHHCTVPEEQQQAISGSSAGSGIKLMTGVCIGDASTLQSIHASRACLGLLLFTGVTKTIRLTIPSVRSNVMIMHIIAYADASFSKCKYILLLKYIMHSAAASATITCSPSLLNYICECVLGPCLQPDCISSDMRAAILLAVSWRPAGICLLSCSTVRSSRAL